MLHSFNANYFLQYFNSFGYVGKSCFFGSIFLTNFSILKTPKNTVAEVTQYSMGLFKVPFNRVKK
jgi:hypothetical protein